MSRTVGTVKDDAAQLLKLFQPLPLNSTRWGPTDWDFWVTFWAAQSDSHSDFPKEKQKGTKGGEGGL